LQQLGTPPPTPSPIFERGLIQIGYISDRFFKNPISVKTQFL
jgi:hypothetical protein